MKQNTNPNVRWQTRDPMYEPGLDWDKVNYIRANFKEDDPFRGCKGMAKKFGVNANAIRKVVNGVTWIPRDWADDVEPPKTKAKILAEWRKTMKGTKRIQEQLKKLYPDREIEEDTFFNECGYEMLKDLLKNR